MGYIDNPKDVCSDICEFLEYDTYYKERFTKDNITDEQYINDIERGVLKDIEYKQYYYYFNMNLRYFIDNLYKCDLEWWCLDLFMAFAKYKYVCDELINVYINDYKKLSIIEKFIEDNPDVSNEDISNYIFGYLMYKLALFAIDNQNKQLYLGDIFKIYKRISYKPTEPFIYYIKKSFPDNSSKYFREINGKLEKVAKDRL